ncbi:MAG: amidohydrolase family protein, partial [Eubacteriales bacterium]|nr:amidohydrolase family protein [Eubacteriales bacterium]
RSDPESIYRGVKNGAKIVTHLFDAMGNYKGKEEAFQTTGDPQESVSDIVLSIPDMYYELICDSRCIHVKAVSIRQTYKNAGEDYIICISDTTGRPNQLNPEDYPPEDPKSARDLNFNQRGQLSGSRLVTAQSVANFIKNTGVDVRVGFKVGSTNSARALNLYDNYGSIDAGKYANIIFVDDSFSVKNVIFKGTELDEIRD